MKTIRWGIVGCGNVTEVKSGPAFQKANDSQLVAVMRRDAASAQDYAKRHGVARWYDDVDALINDANVDAVYVATPPGAHLEVALKVAAAGKPCYVEKPMARSHLECRTMIDAFAVKKLPLFVAYYRRALPRFVKLKEILDSGSIGTITSCRYHMTRLFRPGPSTEWRLNVEQSGGGLFLDVGSHVLDLLDFLMGDFVEVSGSANGTDAGEAEDRVAMSFLTSRGIVGTGTWNFAGNTKEELLIIEGTHGRIETEVLGWTPLTTRRGDSVEQIDLPDPPHIQQPLIQSVVDDLLGRTHCPSTGESASRTSKVMDTVLKNFYGHRDDAFWNRPQTWKRTIGK